MRDGDARAWRDAVDRGSVSCDGLGCIARRDGLVIALAARAEALDEDCARADLVISAAPIFSCAGPKLVLGEGEIASGAGYALTLCRFVPKASIKVGASGLG